MIELILSATITLIALALLLVRLGSLITRLARIVAAQVSSFTDRY